MLTKKLPGTSVEKTSVVGKHHVIMSFLFKETQGTLSHASWRCRGCNNFIIRIQDLQSQQNGAGKTGENTMHFNLKLRISSRFVRIFYFCCLLAFDFLESGRKTTFLGELWKKKGVAVPFFPSSCTFCTWKGPSKKAGKGRKASKFPAGQGFFQYTNSGITWNT